MALWFVVSIRAIIACARARDTSDEFKLTVGLALVGMVGIVRTAAMWAGGPWSPHQPRQDVETLPPYTK